MLKDQRLLRRFSKAGQAEADRVMVALDSSVEQIFKAATQYYKLNRKDEDDANNFMRREGHHDGLKQLWKSTEGSRFRQSFAKHRDKLATALQDMED